MVLWIVGFCLCGALGLMAVAAPRAFQRLAQRSSKWVDSEKLLAVLDKRVDIDAYVLRYTRLFGAAVLCGLCAAWMLYTRRG
jgi:hypothetical protein